MLLFTSVFIWSYSLQLKLVISGKKIFLLTNRTPYLLLLKRRIYFYVVGTVVTNCTKIMFNRYSNKIKITSSQSCHYISIPCYTSAADFKTLQKGQKSVRAPNPSGTFLLHPGALQSQVCHNNAWDSFGGV